MATQGQRFTLDPDADNFTFNIEHDNANYHASNGQSFIGEIRERESSAPPPPPKPKQTKTGFPVHRRREELSALKMKQPQNVSDQSEFNASPQQQGEPSNQAIFNHIARKSGIDPAQKEKDTISEENKRRIAQMSVEDIQDARAEIMSSMSPAFIERLLKRANIDEDQDDQGWDKQIRSDTVTDKTTTNPVFKRENVGSSLSGEDTMAQRATVGAESARQQQYHNVQPTESQFIEVVPSIHFPVPPRDPNKYVALDPDSPAFLADLRKHYFPDLPDDPTTMAWLQDPTHEESASSPYAPTQTRYAPSDIRFGFTGRLIAPNESREIPASHGLHHHGQAPESAGYTIPELSILARSVLPNQRCVAYQILGRILYRLGRGDFGQRGSELVEGLWGCIEKERPIEVMMSEANRTGGHVSAKAYATESLWLWRKGGGGERGLLKPSERVAK